MKKLLATILAAVMLSGLFITTSSAAGKENLCKYFNSTVGEAVSDYFGSDIDGIEGTYEKVPVGYLFVSYIQHCMEQDGSLKQYAVSGTTGIPQYKVPFDVFEAKAKSIADYSGDLKAQAYERYDSASDCMVFKGESYGMNQGHPAFVIGYNDNGNNNYTVYVQRMQYGCDTVEEVKEIFGDCSDDEIFQDYDGLYHQVHDMFYITEVKYENDSVFYQSVKYVESLDGISMITRDTVITDDAAVSADGDGCSVSAEKGVFPAGTDIRIQKVTEGGNLAVVKTAMKNIAQKFTVYDISAVNNNAEVQPNGKVKVTFAIPSGYDADKLAVYYVGADGSAQKLNSVVDQAAKTITVELTHFSTYVVAQTTDSGSKTSPATGDTANLLLLGVLLLASGGLFAAAACKNKKKTNE